MHGKDLPFDTVCMPNHYRGAECRKLPCALSAGRIKELIHLWKTNRLFRYDLSIILAQDMNSSVILITSEGGGERRCIVEQEVLKDMCCTWWTGSWHFQACPPSPGPHVSSPGSNLQTQTSAAGSSPGCWVDLSGTLWSSLRPPPSPLYPDVNTHRQPSAGVKWGGLLSLLPPSHWN